MWWSGTMRGFWRLGSVVLVVIGLSLAGLAAAGDDTTNSASPYSAICHEVRGQLGSLRSVESSLPAGGALTAVAFRSSFVEVLEQSPDAALARDGRALERPGATVGSLIADLGRAAGECRALQS